MEKVVVPYVNIALQNKNIKNQLLRTIEKVIDEGKYILGCEVEAFENRFAEYCGSKYAVAVSDGTASLILIMTALGIGVGDEVITVPNSFIATAASIAAVGARPIFVDVDNSYNIDIGKIEEKITKETKAILPVHLTGRPAEMNAIMEIATRYGLYVIEDSAQAVGAKYHGKKVGTFGIAGSFSFHPLKNLSAIGDGGIITTDDKNVFEKLKKLRNHGLANRDECDFWGVNSRLDTIQAAILDVKMNMLDEWTIKRRENAEYYSSKLNGVVQVPGQNEYEYNVYHTYIVLCSRRDELKEYLLKRGIETKIHYPIPIHLQQPALKLGYKKGDFPVTESQAQRILSLPIYPELNNDQKEYVVSEIISFYS